MSVVKCKQHGLSLVELMIAMGLGLVLLLGLVQVFAASRTAYQMSEGVSRVQENARFALDFLQRDLRMVGHMGCVNDQARLLTSTGFSNRLVSGADSRLQFGMAVQAYEADGSGPGDTISIASSPAAGTWRGSPALPPYLAALNPLPGSDIVVLRFFSPEGIPVTSFTPGSPATIAVDAVRWNDVIKSDGFSDPGLLGMADCISASTFQASTVNTGSGQLTVSAKAGFNDETGLSLANFVAGQAMLYRAETQVFYLGLNAAARPSLYRARYTVAPGGNALALVSGSAEELVEGIDSMQLLFGLDAETNQAKPPTGYIVAQYTASELEKQCSVAKHCWNRVGQVRVAFLSRSTEPAASSKPVNARNLLGSELTLPDDGRYRAAYESTIALRNRLYGN